MAPRDIRKPPALSDEYVLDSSDDPDAVHLDENKKADVQRIPETPFKRRKITEVNQDQNRNTATPSQISSSKPQSQRDCKADGDEVDEVDLEASPLLDESAKQAASKIPPGKEPRRKKFNTTPALQRSIPPKQYLPPTGFVKASAAAPESASSAIQFLTNDLTGKEIWHIIAPANVPMESIKPFAIRAAMRGEPILDFEGKWYCLSDGPSTEKRTFTPTDTGDAYVPGKAAILRTYHLREIINLPAKDKGPNVNPSKQMYFEFQPNDELPVRPKRKQPEGLRMRYKPFGTTDASVEESAAGKLNIYIPDKIASPSADYHRRGKQKSHENPRSQAAEADSGVMQVDPSQTPLGMQTASPRSSKSSKHNLSKEDLYDASLVRQEKTTKKSEKNKDREAAST